MDESEFSRFHHQTARPLWAYLHRLTSDPALADDLLQEAYLRLLRSRVTAPDEIHLKAYLYRIATNLVHDHWNRQKQKTGYVAEARQMAPETLVDPTQDFAMAQAFQKLTLQERSLLWLAYVEGHLHREISQVLHLKEGSIRVLLFRARRKLAQLLQLEEVTVPKEKP
ncbi:MAG: RNA polymerase sigma factor [Blastocatellia bacterium]|nr:RNA polymerase sigma factor [Blastocatellia bacterium]